MPGVFLNFRSADAGSYAAALLDEVLRSLFGDDLVFRSSRSIPAGAQFDEVLLEAAENCDVMLSLVGPDWLTAGGETPYLEREDDWVRREITIALGRGIPVIPVLLTDAKRPGRDQLPGDMADLADRQAVYLRHRHLGPDLAHLLGELVNVAPQLAVAGMFAESTALPELVLPSVLLRAEYAVVPFGGRQRELADLTAWCVDSARLSAYLMTGPAGQGKTRLALHLSALVRKQGWLAGVLTADVGTERLTRLARISVPLLLVVDYAEAQAPILVQLAERFTRRKGAAPVRLLLLARAAGEWQATLHESADDRVAGLFVGAVERSLPPLTAKVADRHAEFVRALRALAPHVEGDPDLVDLPPDMDTGRYERALDLHAAALAMLLDQRSDGHSSDPASSPILRVLHHERRYWRRTSPVYHLYARSMKELSAAVAVATMYGAATAAEAKSLLGSVLDGGDEAAGTYLRWLQALYPGPMVLNPLRPDRLGEDHVAAVLADEPRVATVPAVTVDDARLRQALTVLGRAAPRHGGVTEVLAEIARPAPGRFADVAIRVATQLEDPRALVGTLEAAVAEAGDHGLTELVRSKLPDDTVALARLAVLVNETALQAHLRLPDRDPAYTAHLFTGLTRSLRQQGRYAEALEANTECAEIYRRLAKTERDTYLPNFVLAMQMRSVCLNDVGQYQEALEAAEVAVAGFRELAADRTDAYQPELANALNAMSNRLRALDRHWEAVRAAAEAVDLYLHLTDADRLRPDLARALNGLAVHLCAVNEFDQAVDVFTDAIVLRRQLAEHNPDAYLRDLASSLNNCAILLDDIGREAEAVILLEEAVDIYRRLADHQPRVFVPDLAMALGNYGLGCSAVGRLDEGLEASTESVELYRSLAEQQPALYADDLAMALNNSANRLAGLGRYEEALADVSESVRIRRALPGSLKGLVASLNNLGIRLRQLNRHEEAVVAAREAVEVCRQLNDAVRLADALNGLALAEARIGDREASERAADEAVQLVRPMYVAQPRAQRRRLASVLVNLAEVTAREAPAVRELLDEAEKLCDPGSDAGLLERIHQLYRRT